MSDRVLTGGCQCGAVRYRVKGPVEDIYHCHCAMCRRLQGALFGTYASYREENFELTTPEADLATYDSSPGTHRLFCKACGCNIFGRADGMPGQVYVSVATLDGGAAPEGYREKLHHIFVGSKVPWYPLRDGLPQREEY